MRAQIVRLIVLLTSTSLVSAQTTYTFSPSGDEGTWGDSGNWTPPGIPVAGDTAIIDEGKTCQVVNGNRAAKIITVRSGATLVIEGKTLTIGDGSSTTQPLLGVISAG